MLSILCSAFAGAEAPFSCEYSPLVSQAFPGALSRKRGRPGQRGFKPLPPDTPRDGPAPPLIGSAAGTAGFQLAGLARRPAPVAGGLAVGAAAGSGRARGALPACRERARPVPAMALLLLLRRLLRYLGWPHPQVRPRGRRCLRAGRLAGSRWARRREGGKVGAAGGGAASAPSWPAVGSVGTRCPRVGSPP